MTFWMSGMHHRQIEAELPCPAWMVPPTEVEIPTLVLGSDDESSQETFDFEGHKLSFKKIYLQFNPHEETPVIVKKMGTKLFALLVREHLSCPEFFLVGLWTVNIGDDKNSFHWHMPIPDMFMT